MPFYHSFEELSQALETGHITREKALAAQHSTRGWRFSRKQISRLNKELMEEFAKEENEIKE